MRIDQLNKDALQVALNEFEKSSYYKYYNPCFGVIDYILDLQIDFNDDGTIFGEYRTCIGCGCDMVEGCVLFDSDYYCEECLHKDYTKEKYQELYDNDLAYWTQWY